MKPVFRGSVPRAPDLLDLLEKTSRTFALAIPALPEPTRREVTIAYLLFRIADTFEDAAHWPASHRLAALADFQRLLVEPDDGEAAAKAVAWASSVPSHHPGYARLVAETPGVLEAFLALDPGAVRPIRDHVVRSAQGMAEFVARTKGNEMALENLEELRRYCYVVAGLVGEMLTELFLLRRAPLAREAGFLRERAATFGEALQLVNILKDADADAAEGRRYLPAGVPRSEVFGLARRDLLVAADYIGALQRAGAPRGIVEFTALPVELAWSSLEKIEAHGAGSKVSRLEVVRISRRVRLALDQGRPAVAPRP